MESEEMVNSSALSKVKINVRENVKHDRENQRHNKTDVLRIGLNNIIKDNLENEHITEKDIIGLVSRIKRRKQATSSDLTRLSNGFLQNETYIKTFMKIPGAITIIIKELTGKENNRQILACECLCNLSLGDEISCEKIALYAGPYILTYMSSLNNRLSATCIILISNLISTGIKPLQLLLNQKLVQQILSYIKDEEQIKAKQEYFSILYYILLHGQTLLTDEDCNGICSTILLNHCFSTLEEFRLLQRTLFCLQYQVDEETTLKVIKCGLMKLNEFRLEKNLYSTNDIETQFYIIRIISNIIAVNKYGPKYFIEYFEHSFVNITDYFNDFFSKNTYQIEKELCWLLGNFYNSQNEFIVKYLEKYSLTDIKISKSLQLL